MSIDDPITIEYDEKRDKYYLKQGRETFYDDNKEWILFDTAEDATKHIEMIDAIDHITHAEWHGMTPEERNALCDEEIKKCKAKE